MVNKNVAAAKLRGHDPPAASEDLKLLFRLDAEGVFAQRGEVDPQRLKVLTQAALDGRGGILRPGKAARATSRFLN